MCSLLKVNYFLNGALYKSAALFLLETPKNITECNGAFNLRSKNGRGLTEMYWTGNKRHLE